MKNMFFSFVMVVIFGFALTVNAEELEEPSGCRPGNKIHITQQVGWHTDVLTDIPVLRVALEITPPEGVEILNVWVHVKYKKRLYHTQKAPFTIEWDGERHWCVYFDQNQLPAGAEINYTIKGILGSTVFYKNTGNLDFQSDPKEISPLPGEFDGLEMLSPPAPKAPAKKPKRQGASDHTAFARA